jgi:hypothetical protein
MPGRIEEEARDSLTRIGFEYEHRMSYWQYTILALFAMRLASAQSTRFDAAIYDPASKPLPTAVIHLVPRFGSPDRYEAKANQDGEVHLLSIAPGTYVLSIKAPGFVEVLREIRVTPGENTNLGKVKLVATACGDPDGSCVPDSGESPVMTMPVCSLLHDIAAYSRRRVVVVGWLTTDGAEVRLADDCDFKLITAGSVWPNAIAVSGLPPSFQLSLSKQVSIVGVLKVLSSPLVVECNTGRVCSYSFHFYPQPVARLEQASIQTAK